MRRKIILAIFACVSWASAQTLENQLNDLFTRLVGQMPVLQMGSATVAVLPFSLREGVNDTHSGECIAEYAVSFILTQPQLKVVERAAFQKVMAEVALSQTGALSDEKTIEAGKLLAADYLLTGSVGDVMGKRLISARLIRTETGMVMGSATITVPAATLDDFTKELLGEKTQVSASIYRSLVAPGWGQFYAGHPKHGTVFTALAAVSVGFVTWALIDLAGKNSDVESFNNAQNYIVGEPIEQLAQRKNAAIDAQNKAGVFANLTLGATALVWGVNLIDTYVLGKSQKERVETLYFRN